MRAVTAPLAEIAEFEEIVREQKKEKGMLQISGCVTSQKTHLVYGLGRDVRYRLYVLSSGEKARKVLEEYRFLDENVRYYPAKDMLFYQADIRGKELVAQRMEALQMLLAGEGGTLITTVDAFMDSLLPLKEIESRLLHIGYGETLDFEKLKADVSALGYEREVQVEAPGQFAIRGGILDIWALTEETPVRIEFWGDEVDSIRTFDAESQRSIENLKEITVYPADEFPEEKNRVSFLDYFSPEETVIYLDEPARLLERGAEVEAEVLKARENRENEEESRTREFPEPVFYTTEEMVKKLNRFSLVGLCALETRCRPFLIRGLYSVQARSVNPYNGSFELLTQDLKRLKRGGSRVVLLSGSRTRAKRLAEDLRDYNLSSFYSDDMEREVRPGEILVAYGHVEAGYEYPLIKFVVISETDIFGRTRKKRKTGGLRGP